MVWYVYLGRYFPLATKCYKIGVKGGEDSWLVATSRF